MEGTFDIKDVCRAWWTSIITFFNVIKWNTRQKIMPTSCTMHHTKSLDALANHDSMIVAPELS